MDKKRECFIFAKNIYMATASDLSVGILDGLIWVIFSPRNKLSASIKYVLPVAAAIFSDKKSDLLMFASFALLNAVFSSK